MYLVHSTPVCYATEETLFITDVPRLLLLGSGMQLLGCRGSTPVSRKPSSTMPIGNPIVPVWCLCLLNPVSLSVVWFLPATRAVANITKIKYHGRGMESALLVPRRTYLNDVNVFKNWSSNCGIYRVTFLVFRISPYSASLRRWGGTTVGQWRSNNAPRELTESFSIVAPGGYIDGSSMTEATLSQRFLVRM